MNNEKIKRLSPEEEQGRIKGGRILTEATFIAGGYPTTSRDNKRANYHLQNEEQTHLLEQHADENKLWFYSHEKLGIYIDNGDEQFVYVRPEEMMVYKINDLYFHETPVEFFDRIAIHNYLFPEAWYEMLGFTYSNKDKFSIVLRQPFVVAERGAYREEVLAEMDKLGYEHAGGTTFVSEDYIIEDLHPGNVLKVNADIYAFIDPVIYLNTPDEDMDGNRSIGQYADN